MTSHQPPDRDTGAVAGRGPGAAGPFHRRHHLPWTSAAAGLAGAPLLLALILAAVPAILGRWGLLPT